MKNKTLLSASLALMMAMNAETGKLRTVVEERANTFVNYGSRLQPRSILIWMLIMWQSMAVRQADRRDTTAVLLHGDFYKAAYSACGCQKVAICLFQGFFCSFYCISRYIFVILRH